MIVMIAQQIILVGQQNIRKEVLLVNLITQMARVALSLIRMIVLLGVILISSRCTIVQCMTILEILVKK